MFNKSVAVIDRISNISGIIAMIFLVAMMLITVSDVCMRYFFNSPISGSQEIVEYFMVVTGFLGLALCALKSEHVKVDLLVNRLSPRFQSILDSITSVLTLTVLPLLVMQSFVQAWNAYQEKTTATIIKIPDYPFYLAEGLGCFLLLLVVVIMLANFITKARVK